MLVSGAQVDALVYPAREMQLFMIWQTHDRGDAVQMPSSIGVLEEAQPKTGPGT